MNAPTVTAPLTDARTVVATAAYMSPEQAEGRTLDARSDIFSFGAVLYEMATGQRPFHGDSWLALLSKILTEDPKPPALVAAIPPELDRISLRCLRKDPGRRYQTVTDLQVALQDLQHESGSSRRVQAGRSRHRWAWAALMPVLLVAGLLAWRAW